ncbi:MAG: hypothetical protein GXO48_09795 [Chlorobi bacterium]|nr:hypothetical protein [Chlorobiota bacterium]
MELLLLWRGKIEGFRKWGRGFKLLPFFIVLVMLSSCKGISISIEDSTDDVSKAKRKEIMTKMKQLQEYDIATDGYKLLISDSVYYPYPILREKLKLVTLKDGIVKHSYEVEISPLYNSRLQNYSVLEYTHDSLIVVGFSDNRGDLYIDVIDLKNLNLFLSLKCKSDNEDAVITAIEMLDDSLFVVGASASNETYIYAIKVMGGKQCFIEQRLLIDTFFDGSYTPFYVADIYQSKDTLHAVAYVQSSGWDSNYLAVVRMNASGKIYEVKRYLDRLIPFSTVENMNNLNAGRLALINNRVAVVGSEEYVVLHPFKPVYYDGFGNIDTLERFVNKRLYAFQDSILNSKFDAYTCRSGTIVNIPEFEDTKSRHGFVLQNKIIKGTESWGTNIYVKDTTTNMGFASIIAQILQNGMVRKYRTISVVSILDGLRLIGKIGGSPFSKEEINSMKVDLGSPSELLSAVGYVGFGGCYFASENSLLCVAYISDGIPSLDENKTIINMGKIPYSELSQIGKVEKVDVRMIVGVWTITD